MRHFGNDSIYSIDAVFGEEVHCAAELSMTGFALEPRQKKSLTVENLGLDLVHSCRLDFFEIHSAEVGMMSYVPGTLAS